MAWWRLDHADDLVRVEIETALQANAPIIRRLVDGATMPDESDLPASMRGLAGVNALSVRSNPDFHEDVQKLCTAVQRW